MTNIPAVNTSTTTTTAVITFTNTMTVTPLETVTTATTSTTTVTGLATSTVVTCAQQTNSVAGISYGGVGHLEGNSATTIPECCVACYNSPLGCNGWAFLGSGFCFISVIGPTDAGREITGDVLCPYGKSNARLSLNGPDNLAGGPGPCHRG